MIQFNQDAFIKPIIHASKYPWAPVSGFFIGKKSSSSDQDGDSSASASTSASKSKGKSASSSGSDTIVVVDAIPVFHNAIVSPVLEVAAMMVSEYAAANELVVVGYYTANQRSDDVSLNPVVKKVVQRIIQTFSDGFVAVINNEKIASDKSFPYNIHQGANLDIVISSYEESDQSSQNGSQKTKAIKAEFSPSLKEIQSNLSKVLKRGDFEKTFHDFEESLTDVSLDWRNLQLL